MIKVFFEDMYGGTSSIFIGLNEDSRTLHDVIEDFIYIVGDQLSDASAMSTARKFRAYAKRIGYPTEVNSRRPASENIIVDLASASISPPMQSGDELRLPTHDSSIQNVDDDGVIDQIEAVKVGDEVGVDFMEVSPSEFHEGLVTEHSEHSQHYGDDVLVSGRIAADHLKEDPRYYTRRG